MAESLRVFENSLKDYLVNVMADFHNSTKQVAYRYNNLKLYMDSKKTNLPHFYVTLGISEACFDLENLEVMAGSIGSNERYITRWASRPNINGELRKQWSYISNAMSSHLSSSANSEELEEKLKLEDAEKVQLVGSGKKRVLKDFESSMRKKRTWQKP